MSLAKRLETTVEHAAREARVDEVRLFGVPVFFRYGRQLALWSWHLIIRVSDNEGRNGVGITPGYAGRATPSLDAIARLVGRLGIDRASVAGDSSAAAALDTALLDLVGAGVAGLETKPIVIEGMVWFHRDPAHVARQARTLRERGFVRAKVKLSGSAATDMRILDGVLEHFEADSVRVDANRSYGSTREAATFARHLVARGCAWIEEPTADPQSWPELAAETGALVLGDESLAGCEQLDQALENGYVTGVNIKLARVGGPVRAVELIERCERSGVHPFVGCSEDLSSGMAAVLHAAAATSHRIAEGWGALRLGLEGWDTVVRRFEAGAIAEWEPLGSTPVDRPFPRGRILVRPGASARAASSAFHLAEAVSSRALRLLPERRGPAEGRQA